MERIRILHEKFSATKETRLGTFLITELPLDLIDATSIEILIGLDEFTYEWRDNFLMSRIEGILFSLCSWKLEEDID